jgi:Flp pilus assembly protein TadD/TolB-like protein
MSRESDGSRSREGRIPVVGVLVCSIVLAFAALASGCGRESSEATDDRPFLVQVLPFEVRGQEEGADYVGRAIAGSIANNLSGSEDLRLLEVPERGEPGADVATRLITGSLKRTGGAIRAQLQLLDPTKDEVLWETEVPSDTADLSRLAHRLAMQAIRSMEVSYPVLYEYIGDIRSGPEMSESPLKSEAIDAWLKSDTKKLLQASSTLLAHFGDDPAAHAIDAWAQMISWDAAPLSETRLTRLKESLVELDRVDPESPYDEIMLGYVYRSSGQPDQARTLYSRVLARSDLSSVARSWVLRQRSFTFLQTGSPDAARDDAQEAVRLDPSHAAAHVALSKAFEALGDLDGAVLHSNRALALQPSSWRQHQRVGLVYIRGGKFEEAAATIGRACQLSENQEPCANLAVALLRAGHDAEARRAAEYAGSLAGSRWGFYNLACFQALAGDEAEALDSLHRSIELGFADILITTDPDLDSLRNDRRFREIEAGVEDRISSLQELSTSVFPWQA